MRHNGDLQRDPRAGDRIRDKASGWTGEVLSIFEPVFYVRLDGPHSTTYTWLHRNRFELVGVKRHARTADR